MWNNANVFVHAFSTFMGMPAEVKDSPACGAVLSSEYDNGRRYNDDGSKIVRPKCPICSWHVAAFIMRKSQIVKP